MNGEGPKKERYFEAHFEELRDLLLRISYLAMEAYSRALDGLFSRDAALCEKVVEADKEIDKLEIRIDQACIDILMAHQPVAKDLRFVTMAMKINTNLERMGDQAVYIARVGCDLSVLPPMREVFALPELGERVKSAVQGAIDSFIEEDADLARRVRAGDEEINRFHRDMIEKLLQYMMENPSQIAQAVEMIFLARALERVADYGKNIAAEVIYLVEAVDARHNSLK
jgi:phosphate transport system protein